MELKYGDYTLSFKNGGLEVVKDSKLLHFNKQTMFAKVKTMFAVSEFYDNAYHDIIHTGDKALVKGVLTTPSGTEFSFYDSYEVVFAGFKMSRNVKVLKAGDDLGFSTKITFVMTESNDTHDYNCFVPGVWYKQNEFAPNHAFGKDPEERAKRNRIYE